MDASVSDLPAVALDALAERGVRLRARCGRLEAQVPEAARSERLDAWLARHRHELIAMACESCGEILFSGYTNAGKQRCQACMSARCRQCYREIPHDATSCAACSTSPLVRHALAIGAREAQP